MSIRKPTINSKPAVPVTEYKWGQSSERLVGSNGELNGNSNKDLLQQQLRLMSAASNREVVDENQQKMGRAILEAAYNEPENFKILGEKMADALYMTQNRQGFMRKLLARVDTPMGTMPRFKVYKKDVTAVYVTGPTRVSPQIIRDKFLFPPEFPIVARPFITSTDLYQSQGDVLAEKHTEALEAHMVKTDRLWYSAANAMVGIDNELNIISGQLTPYAFAVGQAQLTGWGLRADKVLLASDLWADIIGNQSFYTAIDPVARHELLMTGQVGTLYGSLVLTDGFRHPEHKVFNQGEFFLVSDPENHGAYMDRGGIESTPIDITTDLMPGKGWVLVQSIAMAIGNSRSVVKGIRV